MARKCETCGRTLTPGDLSNGRCPGCRSRVKRSAPEHTLAVSGSDDQADGTILPRLRETVDSEDAPDSGSAAPASAGVKEGHRATVDTSVSLASPSIKTIEATDTPSATPAPLRSMATVDSADRTDSGQSVVALGQSSAGPPRRHDSIATVDPRYFESSEWDRWGQAIAGGSATATPRPLNAFGEKRSVSTDSRYVGKTPVAARPLTPPGGEPQPGDEYAITSRLGEGGMGVVFTATQRAIARDVALKMLKPETARRRDRRDNLATEAIVTGELAHPNIVPVYDLGQDADGGLFYSMKRVEGIRWDTVIGTRSESENLDILLRVADAVAFAHDRGVVNRDLKPENVFLGGFGEVLVMDWGLAYATERFKKLDSIVENASMGGSPAYMAPEQARNFLIAGGWRPGQLEPITPALDVYLLGAILFEIVTGQPPHGSDDPTMCVIAAADNQIRHSESTSQLLPIALKAMATDPGARYSSVLAFQQAIREYLSHSESLALTDRAKTQMKEGDLARAVVAFEDALSLWPENPEAFTRVVIARRRLTRRRYALTAVTAGFFLAIASGLTVSTVFWKEADAAAQEARIAATKETKARKDAESAEKEAVIAAGKARRAAQAAALAEKEARQAAAKELAAREAAEIAGEEARKAAERERLAKVDAQRAEQRALIAADEEKKAKKVAVEERDRQQYLRYKAEIANVDRSISENKFSEANQALDQLKDEVPELCGWEWGRLKYLCTQGRQAIDVGSKVTSAATSTDGSFIVTAALDGRIDLWDRDAFSHPDLGARLAFNVPPQPELARPLAVAVSEDGGMIAAAGEADSADPAIFLWPTHSQEQVRPRRLAGHEAGFPINVLQFFAGGSMLMSASANGQIIIWDVGSGSALGQLESTETLFQHKVHFSCGAVAADGSRIVVGTDEGGGSAFVWSLVSTAEGVRFTDQRTFVGHQSRRVHGDSFSYRSGAVTSVAFSPDGQHVYSGDGTGHVLRWDPRIDAVTHEDLMKAQLAVAERRVSEVLTGTSDRKTSTPPAAEHFTTVTAYDDVAAVLSVDIAINAEGDSLVATAGENGVVKLWDPAAWNEGAHDIETIAEFRGHDGRAVAALPVATSDAWDVYSAGEDGTARLWEIDRYAEVRELAHETLSGHEDAILAAGFDPTGRYLLTGGAGQDRRLAVTDLRNPRQRREVIDLAGVFPGTSWVVPVGRERQLLLTGSADGSTVLWDVDTRTPLSRIMALSGNALLPPAASSDGKWIAAMQSTEDLRRQIAIWPTDILVQPDHEDAAAILVKTNGEPAAAAFTADGKYLVAGDAPLDRPLQGGFVYVTDLEQGQTTKTLVFGDGEEGRIAKITPLPGGDVIVAGKAGKANDIRLLRWNPRTRKASSPSPTGDGWAVTLAGTVDLAAIVVDPDGTRLVTLATMRDRSQMLEVWDLSTATGKSIQHQGPLTTVLVTGLAMAPDGKSLLVATEPIDDGANVSRAATVRALDLLTLKEVMFDDNQSILPPEVIGSRAFPLGVSAIAFAHEKSHVYLAGARGVYEFDLDKRLRLKGLFGSHGGIPASGFSADGKYVISGRQDGSFDIYDVEADPALLTPVPLKAPGVYHSPVTAASFSPVAGSYRFLIGRGRGLELYEFDPKSRETRLLRALSGLEDGPTLLAAAAFSADGRWIVAAGDDRTVRMYDIEAKDTAQASFELTPGAFADGVRPVQHAAAITSVAVARVEAPNGRLVVASGSNDKTAIVWVVDPASKRVVTAVPLRGHAQPVTSVAFAPKGFDKLLTGSGDRTARLWDWDGGGIDNWQDASEIANLEPPAGETLTLSGIHTEGLTVVGFSPDGLTALTAGQDGRAVLWPSQPPPPQKPVEAIRQTAPVSPPDGGEAPIDP